MGIYSSYRWAPTWCCLVIWFIAKVIFEQNRIKMSHFAAHYRQWTFLSSQSKSLVWFKLRIILISPERAAWSLLFFQILIKFHCRKMTFNKTYLTRHIVSIMLDIKQNTFDCVFENRWKWKICLNYSVQVNGPMLNSLYVQYIELL